LLSFNEALLVVEVHVSAGEGKLMALRWEEMNGAVGRWIKGGEGINRFGDRCEQSERREVFGNCAQ